MEDLAARVAAHPGWYHTIELAPGLVTPGFCDLRPLSPKAIPAGSMTGKRCLDVGTFDGFWAFTLEGAGADAVYALDLEDGTQADWPPNTRAENERVSRESGLKWGSGFKLAHAALGSTVRRVLGNVYDLDLSWVDGDPVDVVLCGTILQHLRDPTGALERMRSVLKPGGELLMIEAYSTSLTRLHPRKPVAEYRPPAPGSQFTWWLGNLAALRGMATTAGFTDTGAPPVKHVPLRGAAKGDDVTVLRFTA
jgi:tRNA (mo5U34)-methyltransferase